MAYLFRVFERTDVAVVAESEVVVSAVGVCAWTCGGTEKSKKKQ